jgi:hypothetical protein
MEKDARCPSFSVPPAILREKTCKIGRFRAFSLYFVIGLPV